MKSIISGAVAAIAIAACLGVNVQARPIASVHHIAVSDTGKMGKMKMDKMKMGKMKKDSMKMSKKMGKKKMAKDTASKM
jgi:hypothetical protein